MAARRRISTTTVGQETGESWYADSNTSVSADGDDQLRLQRRRAGCKSATDQVTGSAAATDSYTYDLAGEVQSDSQTVPGLTPAVTLSESYTNGNRTQLAAVNRARAASDFVNNYHLLPPLWAR